MTQIHILPNLAIRQVLTADYMKSCNFIQAEEKRERILREEREKEESRRKEEEARIQAEAAAQKQEEEHKAAEAHKKAEDRAAEQVKPYLLDCRVCICCPFVEPLSLETGHTARRRQSSSP